MLQGRQTARTDPPAADRVLDPFAVGSYLTDGDTLLGILGKLPQEPSLRLVEDCRTLEIMVISVQALQAKGVQPLVR
jgi:hypothetical protein